MLGYDGDGVASLLGQLEGTGEAAYAGAVGGGIGLVSVIINQGECESVLRDHMVKRKYV